MNNLHSETFGANVIYIRKFGDSHIVGHSLNGEIQREKIFNPTAYDSDTLSLAMACFDATCNYMEKQTGIPRPMPAAPDFATTVNVH